MKSNLTILLIIAPNNLTYFTNVLNTAIGGVTANGTLYKPSVISISWGTTESSYGSTLIRSINDVFKRASYAGINVCVAAGDDGSSDGSTANSGVNVDYPASSPYVIACGGTSLTCPTGVYTGGGGAATTEVAWNDAGGATGGGVSILNAVPSWQRNLTPSLTGRAVPDMAMNAGVDTGVNFRVLGASYKFGGTSIVAPAFAAYLACVRPRLFVAPALYNAPSTCFHDILMGNNGAYTTKTGYDTCTGWGSIIGTTLKTHLLSQVFVPVTGVTVSPATLNMFSGRTSQLTASIVPQNASAPPDITWSSSRTAVATVNATTGLVTAVATGSATITATTATGTRFTATCVVTVTTPVTSIVITPSTSLTMYVGQAPQQLTATVAPTNALNKTLTWSSTNAAVATVSSTGLVTPVANGSTTIRATANDGSGVVASKTVTVVTFAGIMYNPSTMSVKVNTIATPNLVFNPPSLAGLPVRYTSANTNIATISNIGIVTGKAAGRMTTITATVGTQTAQLTVNVTAATRTVPAVADRFLKLAFAAKRGL